MKDTIFLVLFILLLSCKSDEVKNNSNTIERTTTNNEFNKKNVPYTLIIDEFAYKPFQFQKHSTSILGQLSPKTVDKQPVTNEHLPEQTDTLYTLYFENSQLKIYKALDKEIVVSATIKDESILLQNNIKIGTSKDDFFKTFKELKICNTESNKFRIEISDNEQWVDFEFENNKLKLISFQGYVD